MKRRYGFIALVIFVTAVLSIILFTARRPLLSTLTAPPPSPWNCIGGCGLGGSGGSVSRIRWIGRGVRGYLLTAECLPRFSAGSDWGSALIAPRIALHPRSNCEIGLTLPAGLKIAEVRYQENLPDEAHVNGGPGDIAADINYAFGPGGAFFVMTALTVPTGNYDIRHGPAQAEKILPNELQMGRGVYDASIRLSWAPSLENGMLLIDASLHYPFNVRLDKRNKYLDTDYRAYRDATENRERFYYRWPVKPYGESDRGDYYPPSLTIEGAYGWFRNAAIVHSLQVSFSATLGTRWIRHYEPTRYAPYPDPDHRAWSTLLSYGVEFSRFRFPLFAGFGVPVSDRRGGNNQWDGIDTDALFREWIFVAGFTVGFF
ncbi:MAG: hypothetical protein JW913_05495 [Chitinispirillaceae bacterium]|nr:hypothetical protein [Chitinispirillaceae bacterium]